MLNRMKIHGRQQISLLPALIIAMTEENYAGKCCIHVRVTILDHPEEPVV